MPCSSPLEDVAVPEPVAINPAATKATKGARRQGAKPLGYPAHQPEADAGRVEEMPETLQSRGLTRPLTPASTLPPSAAEPVRAGPC